MKKKVLIFVVSLIVLASTGSAQAGRNKKVSKPLVKEKAAAQEPAGHVAGDARAPQNARFTDKDDGVILDKNTGLVWMKDANISSLPLPYDGARQYVQELNSGRRPNFGYSDWRLPTITEIETLVDKTSFYPALSPGHPFLNVQNNYYWSSSSGKDVVDYLWIVDLASGSVAMDYVSSCSYKFLWPVRSSWMPTTARASTVMTGGLNEYGQLGDGSTTDRESFLPVTGLENVVKVSAGIGHAVALKSDGSVWGWGRNNYGQLGNGSREDSRTPVAAKDLLKITDIASGMFHTVAAASDGTVWTWGRNSYGQLGNGGNEDSRVPVRVKGLSGVVKVAAGMYHSIAVKSDGSVWTWGWNMFGQLGDGSTKDRDTPGAVGGLAKAVTAAAGLHHTAVVLSDKTVWAWGWNAGGVLGDGTRTNQPRPVPVKGLSGVKEIQAGLHHTLALKEDGSVWAWGGNEYAQLGSRTADGAAAFRIDGLGSIKKISAGMYHSVAVMADGTLWTWGKDAKNQPSKEYPVRIWDVAGINDAAAGKFYTLLLSGEKTGQ